jgi:RNA polymerase sigma-70 factor (ECF subfamily)
VTWAGFPTPARPARSAAGCAASRSTGRAPPGAPARAAAAQSGAASSNALDDWESPDGGLEEQWDRDHDRHVLQHLLREAESTFGAATLHAFRRLALDGASAEGVAAETGLTVAAVYLAKSRVLRRLRADAAELLGDDAPRRP